MALKIEKMVSGCRGLAHEDGRTVIVDGVLPGEIVEYRKTAERRGTVEGEAVRILEPSPLRKEPPCPYWGTCGGCNFLFVGEEDSARIKEEIVRDTFLRIGGLEKLPEFLPPAYASFSGYRIRCRVHVDLKTRRQGFLEKGSNRLVEIKSCPALEGKLNAMLSEKGGEIFRRARSLMFENRINRSTGFVEVPLFSGDNSVSLSDKSVGITVSGIHYDVSSSVFFQSNPRLLSEMLSFVEENVVGDDIMDLYSGVGTFSALFEGKGKTVYAVEREKKCLELSRRNAPSAISFTDDCARWAKKSGRHVDTVIVDPPRVGLDKEVVEMIQEWKPQRVIYISCNPVTCARDLSLFTSYRPDLVRVFDAYPGSDHIETGVVLRDKKVDGHIGIDLDVSKLGIKPER